MDKWVCMTIGRLFDGDPHLSDKGWRPAPGTWAARCCRAPPGGTGTPRSCPQPGTPSPIAAQLIAPVTKKKNSEISVLTYLYLHYL